MRVPVYMRGNTERGTDSQPGNRQPGGRPSGIMPPVYMLMPFHMLMPWNSPSAANAWYTDKISLRPSGSPLSPSQQNLVNGVRFAQKKGFVDVYTSGKLRIQYVEDPWGDGALVVYVHPQSPLNTKPSGGRVEIGDVILALDGRPISSPWDLEQHYRWTEVEKISWRSGKIREFWTWLGMF